MRSFEKLAEETLRGPSQILITHPHPTKGTKPNLESTIPKAEDLANKITGKPVTLKSNTPIPKSINC